MFTLQQLKYVLGVIQWGSMSEASRKMFITQPALSNSIRALEEALGIVIFARTKKGISLTAEGSEFAAYARQLVQQSEMLADRYNQAKSAKPYFRISSQHYTFAVEAFIKLINSHEGQGYEFSFHETRTFEVITDVRSLVSEIGLLYISELNSKIIGKVLRENGLLFKKILQAKPHVFVRKGHPLAGEKLLSLGDLAEFPYVFFEQGDYNSLYFAEENVCDIPGKKRVRANDRATLLNIIVGTDAFTVSTGIISEELNGRNFAAVALDIEDSLEIGVIRHQKAVLSPLAEKYIEILEAVVKETRITGNSSAT